MLPLWLLMTVWVTPHAGWAAEPPVSTLSAADAPHPAETQLSIPAPPATFNVHDGGWVRFHYPPEARQRLQTLIEDAPRMRAQLAEQLGHPVLHDVVVYLARTPGEMESFAPTGAPYPAYASGVAYPTLGYILLTLQPLHATDRYDLAETFRHELAHLALADVLQGKAAPRWFDEGFAVFASGEGSFPRMQTLWMATLGDRLIPFEQLRRAFPADADRASIAYAQAADFVRFLVRRQEEQRFASTVELVRGGRGFEQALEIAYGDKLENLAFEWKKDAERRYSVVPVVFSGALIWMAALGLLVWGWRRRRRQARRTLALWERQERLEDALSAAKPEEAPRVHIVLARPKAAVAPIQVLRDQSSGIPRVEQSGRWHTLH